MKKILGMLALGMLLLPSSTVLSKKRVTCSRRNPVVACTCQSNVTRKAFLFSRRLCDSWNLSKEWKCQYACVGTNTRTLNQAPRSQSNNRAKCPSSYRNLCQNLPYCSYCVNKVPRCASGQKTAAYPYKDQHGKCFCFGCMKVPGASSPYLARCSDDTNSATCASGKPYQAKSHKNGVTCWRWTCTKPNRSIPSDHVPGSRTKGDWRVRACSHNASRSPRCAVGSPRKTDSYDSNGPCWIIDCK